MCTKPDRLARVGLTITHQSYPYRHRLQSIARHPGIVLHHMGAGQWESETRNPGQLIHAMHLRVAGGSWAGIGYHGIATQDGQYFTGRSYRTRGSHCPGQNERFGLLWFGGLADQPSSAALETLARAVAWLAIDNGFAPTAQTVTGHLDHLATQCPGNLYQHLSTIIRRATEIVEHNDVVSVRYAGAETQALLQNGKTLLTVENLQQLGLIKAATWNSQTRTVELEAGP